MKEAYLNTHYKVFLDDGKIVSLEIGKKSSELFKHITTLKYWAFITAWNPYPEVLSVEINRKRNTELENILKENNYEFTQGIGVAKDESWQEESLLVQNISKEKAHEIAKKFNQLAFVYGEINNVAELLFTD